MQDFIRVSHTTQIVHLVLTVAFKLFVSIKKRHPILATGHSIRAG